MTTKMASKHPVLAGYYWANATMILVSVAIYYIMGGYRLLSGGRYGLVFIVIGAVLHAATYAGHFLFGWVQQDHPDR